VAQSSNIGEKKKPSPRKNQKTYYREKKIIGRSNFPKKIEEKEPQASTTKSLFSRGRRGFSVSIDREKKKNTVN
jgi:hypothetical protein